MKAKIMLVDDEPSFRLLVQSLLLKEGYEVTEAGSCSSLRQALAGSPPDLVLLDLYLTDGNGLDLLPELRMHWPNTKVIILTGHPGVESAEDAYRVSDVLWLNKPFDAAMLKVMIGVALG